MHSCTMLGHGFYPLSDSAFLLDLAFSFHINYYIKPADRHLALPLPFWFLLIN